MNTQEQIMIKPKELERMRKKWNKPVQKETENPVFIEERVYSTVNYFGRKNSACLMSGNYMIINGVRKPIEVYGEIMVEEQE